jgi:asparagine synthase (glutamine-hydrolysing)
MPIPASVPQNDVMVDPPELTSLELGAGVAVGADPVPPRQAAEGTPAAALERAVRDVLGPGPCLVSFSGGTDSSLVLAAAVRVARREGLPEPVPVTWRFADAPRADEAGWQERVIAALGVRDWERLEAADDELDLVGPVAARVLARHGVVYPANAFLHEPLLRRAAGGSLLTGIGGDQLLGLWRKRALADVLARRRRPSRGLLRALLPERLAPPPWLRAEAQAQLGALYRAELRRDSASWPAHVRFAVGRRDVTLGQATLRALADEAGARVASPLLDPGVVEAVARAGGRFGVGGRVDALQSLFGDLLPAPQHERRDKALFGEVFWRGPARTTMRAWDGGAVDERVVDRGRLRAAWAEADPDRRTALLVQQVWLNTAR